MEEIKASGANLKAALAAAKRDEAKIKDLVKAITSGQDKLFNSFKAQRDEEMALLTPEQQGSLHKWRMEVYEKHSKKMYERPVKRKRGGSWSQSRLFDLTESS